MSFHCKKRVVYFSYDAQGASAAVKQNDTNVNSRSRKRSGPQKVSREYPYPGEIPSLKRTILLLFGVSLFYSVTLSYTDHVYYTNKIPQLPDLGFYLLPKVPEITWLVDFICVSLALSLLTTLGMRGEVDEIKHAILDVTFGGFFSATLHCVTVLPDSREEVIEPYIGGSTDRLMSNHVYNIAVALHVAQSLGWIQTKARYLVLALVSIMIILGRIHYTVDIVLALWVAGAVNRL